MDVLQVFFSDQWIVLDVGTILGFLLWLIWYSPNVFGKKWLKLQKLKNIDPKAYTFFLTFLMNMIVTISIVFVCFSVDFGWTEGINTYTEAFRITILLSIGIITPILSSRNIWLYESWQLFFIDLWYYFILILMISSFYVYHNNMYLYIR